MFDPRLFKTVTDWRTLEDGEVLDSSHGVKLYRVEGLDTDDFIVTRSFGRNGGDGTRIVYHGEDLETGGDMFRIHSEDSQKLRESDTFTMVTNGS